MTKTAVLKRFVKAALDAWTDAELSGEVAEASVKVVSWVPEMGTADPLWSPPDGLPLHRCMTIDVLSSLESLWQDAEFAI